MDTSLIETQVRIPPAPRHMAPRQRLTGLLTREVPAHRLTVVAAPSGYGKTTVLAEWSRQAGTGIAWLSLAHDDNDLERFLRHLLLAWRQVRPDIAERTPAILLEGQHPSPEEVLAALVSAACELATPLAIVLDEYQEIEATSVHRAVTFLVEHLPDHVRVVIGSRTTPPLHLARYRARGELLEIGEDHLRLRTDEADAFLNGSLGLDLDAGSVARLTGQVEGWFAGLQLASLTMRTRASEIPAISGRQRYIADFLREEVLDHLDADTRAFLIETSIADRLCATLCDAITGRKDGQQMLEHLERDHLFTTPLDDERTWYRYHTLFADALRREQERRPEAEIRTLHRRASNWYIDNGMPEPAFDHALAAVDLPLMARVLDAFAQVLLFTGQVRVLQHWLARLPSPWFEQEPILGIFRAATHFFTGQTPAVSPILDEVERRLDPRYDRAASARARLVAVRCFIACATNDLPRAEELANTALTMLTPLDEGYRGGVLGAMGDTYRRNGQWKQAQESYLLALHTMQATPEGQIQSVSVYGALADLELRQGSLHAAAGYWQRALSVIQEDRHWGAYPLPVIGWVHIRLGEILYEWNDLAAASDASSRGRERASLGGDPQAIIAGGILETRLHLARGDLAAAENALEAVRPLMRETAFPDRIGAFDRARVELWLAQRQAREANAWATALLRRGSDLDLDTAPSVLAAARAVIARGERQAIDTVVPMLDRLATEALEEGRLGVAIEALALQALARWSQGERADALTALERALHLAEPEGYVRTFVNLGQPMAQLLQEARTRGVMRPYTTALLDALGASLPIGGSLPEPLSERELEVLRHLSAGLTNREIADALYISPETVKKHTGNIYGKLSVRGRAEAMNRARELGLLD